MTPLSDAITAYIADRSAESWERFVVELARSQLGIIALGMPAGVAGELKTGPNLRITLGTMKAENGASLVLTCADPFVYRERYPTHHFNANTDALTVFETVLRGGTSGGLAVNSAAGDQCVRLTHTQVQQLYDRFRVR